VKFAVTLLAILIFFTLPARAQVAGGSITGTVSGEAGAAIPDVHISVREVSTDLTRNSTTNPAGLYNVSDLSAGSFEMTVSASGFVTQIWTSITVTAGVERVLNVVLKAGKAEPAARMVAPPALVSEPCPSTCGSANTTTVRDTPLNGRDWAALATLQAGVSSVQNGSASGGGNMDRGFGSAVSISGSRPDQNAYILDGISINDYANGAPGSVLGDNLGIDAVQQVAVLGSNYPAEYGRTSGGVISVETAKGSDAFHGSLYEFLRNSALDARNFFDGPVIPPFKRNQFGGSAGLPIRKGRTFIFGDYEGLRQSLGGTTVDTVPSQPARNGILNFSDPSQFPSNCTPTGVTNQCQVTVDPQTARFLAANFFPLPTDPVPAGSNIGVFRFSAQVVTSENYFTTRFDHKFSDSDSIYVTYIRDNSTTVQPGTFGELYSDLVSNRQAATIHEEHIFSPNFLNVAQIGASRAVGIQGKVDHIASAYQTVMTDHQYAFEPGAYAGDIQSIPGVTSFLGAPTAEGFIPSSRALYWTTYQGGDTAVWTHGIHTIKFGGDFERMQDNEVSASNINGLFRFDTLAQFLTNDPSLFSGTGTPLPLDIGMRESLFGAFVEDDIKLRKTLTLNAGLRYEMTTVPTESHGLTTVITSLGLTGTPSAEPVCGVAAPGCSGTGPLFSNPTLRNFEPRLGFAWNPHGGKTLLRGGFGVFDVLPLPYEFTLSFQRAAPFTRTIVGVTPGQGSFTMDPVNGSQAYQDFVNQPDTNLAYYPDPHPKRDYVMQWNLSVARELTSTLALTVGYVGSRGVHEPYRVDNIDMVIPTLTPDGYQWPCGPSGAPGVTCAAGFSPNGTQAAPIQSSRVNTNFGRINATLWQASSNYHAMQVDVAKRTSHGIQFHVAYTFGKSIDTLSASEADDSYPNGLFNQIFFDQRTTRGLSDFNVAQTFVLSATWEIPGPQKGSRLPEWAFGGWQLVGLYKASTGQPFTPIMGGDPVGTLLDETGEVPSILPGCNSVSKDFKKGATPIYLNPNCFTLPTVPTSSLGSLPFQCAAFTGAATPAPAGQTYCSNLHGNLGRNTIIGPGISKLDLSVFKNNYIRRISESFNAQFRAEIFNIFNRANFGSPTDNLPVFDQNGVLQTQTAGLLTATQTTSRQIQFALKLIW
jgi:hypothetical protein